MGYRSLLFMLPLIGAVCCGPCVWADDDDDDDDEREERSADHRERDARHEGSARARPRKEDGRAGSGPTATLAPAANPVYTDTCSACHFAYPPALLPARSWALVLSGMPDHFGETVDLDAKDRAELSAYLQANAADRSNARRAARIMRSVGGGTPKRITEIPYIREKHSELSPGVLKRKSVGSLSNCNACHQHAALGVFEEDDVRIPKP